MLLLVFSLLLQLPVVNTLIDLGLGNAHAVAVLITLKSYCSSGSNPFFYLVFQVVAVFRGKAEASQQGGQGGGGGALLLRPPTLLPPSSSLPPSSPHFFSPTTFNQPAAANARPPLFLGTSQGDQHFSGGWVPVLG